MNKKLKHSIFTLGASLLFFTSCNEQSPGIEYMPDMYKSVGYDTYSQNPNYSDGMTTQLPVDGTIARGQVPYDYPNTNEGYEAAKLESKNPLDVNEANLSNGQKMYDIYCISCHGKTGAGDGILVQRDKFLGIPNYKDRDITEGSIYHVIMYGRNMMGSHASQLNEKERWQVVLYAKSLREDLLK